MGPLPLPRPCICTCRSRHSSCGKCTPCSRCGDSDPDSSVHTTHYAVSRFNHIYDRLTPSATAYRCTVPHGLDTSRILQFTEAFPGSCPPCLLPKSTEEGNSCGETETIGIKKRPAGIEPATSQSAIECSTTELKSLSCLLSFTGALESPISFSHPRHLRTERGEWVTTNTLFIWAGPNSFRES